MKTERKLFSMEGNESANMRRRYRGARIWRAVFFISVSVAIIALATLLISVINQVFGYTIVVDKISPAEISAVPLETLDSEALQAILRQKLTRNRIRTIERELPLAERSQSDLYSLVNDEVVEPRVVKSYNLDRSLLERAQIEADLAQFPEGRLVFRSWLNRAFLTEPMSSKPEEAGVRPALLGSLLLIVITIAFAFPIGTGTAIYLEEYADSRNRLNRLIQTNIENLAGVPSIVYGMLGLAVFVRALRIFTSGDVFGVDAGGTGRTILSAGLTLSLLILPVIIINAQEAIRAVPSSLRQASYGLGATRWQTIWNHVLPYAMPGIMTGSILAISRAMGETAPLIVVGASTLITQDPSGIFSKFTALPIQIYNWTSRPQEEFRHIAAAAILVLLLTLLSVNAFAIILRNRFSRRS